MGGKDINVDENLPPFYKALKYSDAQWLLEENKNLKERYGFKILSVQETEALKTVSIVKRGVQGVPYYIPLANPAYYRDFQYLPAITEDRDSLVVDDDDEEGNDFEQSDMVALLMSMAFIPEDVFKKFNFTKGFLEPFQAEIDAYASKHPLFGKRGKDEPAKKGAEVKKAAAPAKGKTGIN